MGKNKALAHHTYHVFSYASCVDLTQLLACLACFIFGGIFLPLLSSSKTSISGQRIICAYESCDISLRLVVFFLALSVKQRFTLLTGAGTNLPGVGE